MFSSFCATKFYDLKETMRKKNSREVTGHKKWRVPTWEKEIPEILEEEPEEFTIPTPRGARQFHLIGPNSYCHSLD